MHGIACNQELGIEPDNGRSKSVVFYLLASQGLALEGSNYLSRSLGGFWLLYFHSARAKSRHTGASTRERLQSSPALAHSNSCILCLGMCLACISLATASDTKFSSQEITLSHLLVAAAEKVSLPQG